MKTVRFYFVATCKDYDDWATKAMLVEKVFGYKTGYASMIRKKKSIHNCLFIEMIDAYKDEEDFAGKFEKIKKDFTGRGISLLRTYSLKSDEDREFFEANLDSEPELEQIADLCRSKIDLSDFEAFVVEHYENTIKIRRLKVFIPNKKLESATILMRQLREIAQ